MDQKLYPSGETIPGFLSREYTADEIIDNKKYSFIKLNNSSTALSMILPAPVVGKFLIITQKDSGTEGHIVALGKGTVDGDSNALKFNAQNETVVLFGITSTRFIIIANVGSVALPSPSESPSESPSDSPSESASNSPSESASDSPSNSPSESASDSPSESASESASDSPSASESPSESPSTSPSS